MTNTRLGGQVVPEITNAEHAKVGDNEIGAKKVIVLDKDGNQEGLSTAAKQDEIVSAIEAIPATDVSALATHAKQDEIKEAIEGISFDTTGLATSANQTNGNQQTKIRETSPIDETKVNPSLSLSYESGNLTQIDKTIGEATYRKILTWTDGALTAVSAWSQV